MQQQISLRKPDDWHCHLRDGDYLNTTIAHIAERFERVIVMPNLKTPVTTINLADAYYQRILNATPKGHDFQPLMTLYLTDTTTPSLIQQAADHPHIFACKLYPAGATTNSAFGVHACEQLFPVFDAMQTVGLPLLIHGEVTDDQVDIFDRETVFIDTVLTKIIQHFPALNIVLEHITTKHAVDFVTAQSSNVAATITVHHLYMNRNDLLVGGIRPDYYCLPILKTETDRHALLQAALSGNPKFFLGTDSAPHPSNAKYSPCGCAGIYTAHAAIELLLELFEQQDALEKIQPFTSEFGAQFYQQPLNQNSLTFVKQPWQIPQMYPFGDDIVTPFFAGKSLAWQLKN